MLILGIISILQMILIPGLIVCLTIKLAGGGLKIFISSFCLSLTINHFVVLLLTTLNLYTRNILFIFFTCECLILTHLIVARKIFITNVCEYNKDLFIAISNEIVTSESISKMRKILLIVIVCTLLIFLLCLFVTNIGEIFNTWDAICSWNRWAVDWANNKFPSITWHYPQLLPTNFSLTYLFINDSSIQFFAKFIMPLFPLVLLFMFLDLYLKSKHDGFILGSLFAILNLILFNTVIQMVDGYADTPVACMGFAGFYLLIENRYQTDDFSRRTNVIIGSILIAGAALTKQAALILIVLYPLFVILEYEISGYRKTGLGRQLFMALILPLFLILPWYIYVEQNILLRLNPSEITSVTSIVHRNGDTWQKVVHSMSILFGSIQNWPFFYDSIQKITFGLAGGKKSGVLLFTIVLAGVLSCLGSKPYRKYVYAMIIPFTLIWIFFFSYDLRNLSLAAPFLALTSSMGFYNHAYRDRQNLIYLLACHLLIILAIANGYFDHNRLKEMQLVKQKNIVDPSLNELIYKLYNGMKKDQIILSNYQILNYLPGLAQKHEILNAKVKIEDPRVKYILLRNVDDYNNDILNSLTYLTKSNKIKQIQNNGYFILYETVKR